MFSFAAVSALPAYNVCWVSHLVSRCHWLDLYHQAFAAITQALVAALLIMRTVALYQRSKYILGLMGVFLILGCGTIILSITSYQSSVHFTGSLAKMLPGCVFPMTKEQTERELYSRIGTLR